MLRPAAELLTTVGADAEEFGDHDGRKRNREIILQVAATRGQEVVEELPCDAPDDGLELGDPARGEPAVDDVAQAAVGHAVGADDRHGCLFFLTVGLGREFGRTGDGRGHGLGREAGMIVHHPAHVVVTAHDPEVEVGHVLDRRMPAQLGVVGVRIGEHLGCERVVVGERHGAHGAPPSCRRWGVRRGARRERRVGFSSTVDSRTSAAPRIRATKDSDGSV